MTTDPSYQITFADALTKLVWPGADAPAALTNTIDLSTLRNEVTGFQVQLYGDQDFVLVVDRANWQHPLGFVPHVRLEVAFPDLPEGSLEVFPVGYVPGDDGRAWMEYFERSGWAEAQAGRAQPVYVRLRVPKDQPPGEVLGTVRAYTQQGFGDERCIWEGQVRLRVAQNALPDVADYAFHLNLWQHLTSIARFYRVPLWSEAHFALIERYYASLAQLGQKVVSLVVTEMPWSGQRCFRDGAEASYLYEHALVSTTRAADGSLRFDYTALDRILDLAAKQHMAQNIDVFGLLNIWVDEEYGFGKVAPDAPDAVRVRCYDEAKGVFTYLRTAADLRQFIRALQDHLAELGVLERVRVAADEPADLEAFNRSLAFVHQAAPGFQYSAAINHFEFIEDAPAGVIDFTPILPLACHDPALTARLTTQLHARGGKMTWYVCCWPPIPNTFLHSPLPEARLHGWLTHALHLDGFLRWAFCLWPADPWQRVSYRPGSWSAGDLYFVLPGKDGAPVETLRYEALRMAVQDYELIRLVEQALPAEQAQAAISTAQAKILRAPALSAFVDVLQTKAEDLYSLDPADYHAARQVLLEALEK